MEHKSAGGEGGFLHHRLPEVVHNDASTDVVEVCQQLMWSTEQPVHQNPIKSLWDITCVVTSCTTITPLAVQELTDALIRVWVRSPGVHQSSHQECALTLWEQMQARGGLTQRSHVRTGLNSRKLDHRELSLSHFFHVFGFGIFCLPKKSQHINKREIFRWECHGRSLHLQQQ